ncbi:alpha/beta hydrolase [Pendulispora albinea]|uniref:Phospholipase/carboxylesterase/thioesterase domain-containing protein n=1 Tax=Pendulispora albinea TaxID=2741071 RepID=A0ABZ2M2Z9_9BACT
MTLRDGRLPIYAFSPSGDVSRTPPRARPITVYLHGMCGDPGNGCAHFRDGVVESSWLLCPSAPTPCTGGGAIWTGSSDDRAKVIGDAEQRLVARYADAVDVSPGSRVLVGFSQGAYLARDLLRSQPGRYRAVMFIGADVRPAAETLRAAGVRRAVFASGRFDGTRRALENAAAALVQEGYAARFVDLGPVGHTYVPAREEPVLRDALAWLEED